MPSETRYFRADQHTINNFLAYKLGISQTATERSGSHGVSDPPNKETCYWGVRIWKRDSEGNETEITNGTPAAQVSRSVDGEGIQSANWTPSETSLETTDAIVARIYMKIGDGDWTLASTPEKPEFITEQLTAIKLESQQWTVYYYTKRDWDDLLKLTFADFFWGVSNKNSRITNFSYTPVPLDPYPVYGRIKKDGVLQSGVNVTVKNTTKGEQDSVTTTAQGEYSFDLRRLPTYYDDGDGIEVTALGVARTSTVDLTNFKGGREIHIWFYFKDRDLALNIEKAPTFSDRDLSLNIWKYSIADRPLQLNVKHEVLSDRSLSLEVQKQTFADRDLLLRVQHFDLSDRGLALDTELTKFSDRSLSADIDFQALSDRSLSLDIEPITYVGYGDRGLGLAIEQTAFSDASLATNVELTVYQDRGLTLETAISKLSDRGLSLLIEQTGFGDALLGLDVERFTFSDRSLVLNAHFGNVSDRSLSLEVALPEMSDRSLVLEIEPWGFYSDRLLVLDVEKAFEFSDRNFILSVQYFNLSDRSLTLDVDYYGLSDRSLTLEAERFDFDDRSLLLEIEFVGDFSDRPLELNVEVPAFSDRNLSLNTERFVLSDRNFEMNVALPKMSDRNLSMEVEQMEIIDRSLVLDVINVFGFSDRGLTLNVNPFRLGVYLPLKLKIKRS